MVIIKEHQSVDYFTQAFCIDPREFDGTKNSDIKLVGDDWSTVEIMAYENGNELQVLVLLQETKNSN